MRGRDVLQFQLNGSFNLLLERTDAMTDLEWRSRRVAGTSKPGFTVWHGARILDWGVHCAIQGVPELADSSQWAGLRAADFAYGAGITDAEADSVPELVGRQQVREYLSALRLLALDWLNRSGDENLERIPEFEQHQRSHPRYLTAPVWAEVESLAGLPTWQILARPCISHIRVHVGEIDTLRALLRAPAPV